MIIGNIEHLEAWLPTALRQAQCACHGNDRAR